MNDTTSTTLPGAAAIVVNQDSRVVDLEQRLASLEEDFDKLKMFVVEHIKAHSDRIR